MGLTHHWHRPTELPREAFQLAVEDCRLVLAAASENVAGFEGIGAPTFEKDRILFNGAHPQSCEPFEIAAVEFDRRGRDQFFCHCKTEGLPYDLLVRAALIVFAHRLAPSFRVSSDSPDSAWNDARELVQRTLGYGTEFALTRDRD